MASQEVGASFCDLSKSPDTCPRYILCPVRRSRQQGLFLVVMYRKGFCDPSDGDVSYHQGTSHGRKESQRRLKENLVRASALPWSRWSKESGNTHRIGSSRVLVEILVGLLCLG